MEMCLQHFFRGLHAKLTGQTLNTANEVPDYRSGPFPSLEGRFSPDRMQKPILPECASRENNTRVLDFQQGTGGISSDCRTN